MTNHNRPALVKSVLIIPVEVTTTPRGIVNCAMPGVCIPKRPIHVSWLYASGVAHQPFQVRIIPRRLGRTCINPLMPSPPSIVVAGFHTCSKPRERLVYFLPSSCLPIALATCEIEKSSKAYWTCARSSMHSHEWSKWHYFKSARDLTRVHAPMSLPTNWQIPFLKVTWRLNTGNWVTVRNNVTEGFPNACLSPGVIPVWAFDLRILKKRSVQFVRRNA